MNKAEVREVVDREEFGRWVKQADHTLVSAVRDANGGDFSWASFKAEQAAQYALKALLVGLGRPAFGHSVHRLAHRVVEAGVDVPAEIMTAARELERHYIPSRYPDAYPSGSPFEFYQEHDARQAIAQATIMLEYVREVFERVDLL